MPGHRLISLPAVALLPLVALAGCRAWTPPEATGDLAVGRDKARQCRSCHGIDGVARIPNAPHLAGESALYIEKQLRAFRAGERKDPQMSVIAKGLSDDDIADIAAWYSAIEISVELPGAEGDDGN